MVSLCSRLNEIFGVQCPVKLILHNIWISLLLSVEFMFNDMLFSERATMNMFISKIEAKEYFKIFKAKHKH